VRAAYEFKRGMDGTPNNGGHVNTIETSMHGPYSTLVSHFLAVALKLKLLKKLHQIFWLSF
jgi:hypothetical protein